MEKDRPKPWERPWSTDEIREHSANWNLAGDSGLLNHLQQFSQNLLATTHATEVALDNLMEDLKTTSTSVENATNTFLFLANTQFVENRVYDDDEKETPPEEKKDDVKPPKTKEEQEAEVFENVRQALHMGLALLDTHFEAVEVPASDSEEEESSASVGRLVLKPKNPYISRPLPYLIGSREFMEDDNVGLGEISSDTEESPDQNIVQSSESDEEMEHDELVVTPKRPMVLSSSDLENSEPESDRSETMSKQKKLRTSSKISALGEEVEDRDMFGQESPPEADEASIVKGGMKPAFSDELASKLGAVKPQNESERENVKDNIFVPSPESEDDGLFSKGSRSFADKQGLFDDLEDWQSTSNSLWKNDNVPSVKPPADTLKGSHLEKKTLPNDISENTGAEDEVDEIFTVSKMKKSLPATISRNEKMSASTPQDEILPKPKIDTLFEPTDESDDLFSQKVKDTGSTSGKPALFGKDDLEDDDLFAIPSSTDNSQPGPSLDGTKKKKLPGAVHLFSGVDLFGDLSPIVQQSSTVENIVEQNVLSGGSALQSQESSSGIGSSNDLLRKDGETESQERIVASQENSSALDCHSSQFFQNVVASSTKITDSGKSSLFNAEIDSDSLFDKARSSDQKNLSVSKTSASLSSSLKSKMKKTVSLFDDSDSGDDELLFSSTSSTSSRSRRSQGSGDVLGGPVERRTLPKKELFDDSVLFGSGNKDEPDVDIFSSQIESKSNTRSLTKDNVHSGGDVFSDGLTANKKVTSSLFDDIDEVDDIFAVTKVSTVETEKNVGIKSQTDLGKISLFSDDLGGSGDIFFNKVDARSIKGDDPVAEVPSQSGNVVSSIPDDVSGKMNDSSSVNVMNDNSSSLLPKNYSAQHSVPSIDFISEKKSIKNVKPAISQKPIVPIKPIPSSVSSQNVANSSPSSSVTKVDRSSSSVNDERTEGTQKLSEVEANEHGQDLSKDTLVQKGSDDQMSVSSVKPEPPRTLNIRKTTGLVFGSPSNEEDDLFGSAWSDKSTTGMESAPIEKLENNTISSSNFSKLLESFNSNSAIPSTGTISREQNSISSEGSSKNLDSSDALDENESRNIISSPIKLLIDPRTLLPGARPPSKVVSSDEAIGFDKPAETTSTLHSAAKERVKIQVRRRPQTRRARQEALRASSIEYDNIDAALISQIANNRNDNVQNSIISSSASSSSPVHNATPRIFEPNSSKNSPVAEKNSSILSEKDPKSNSEGLSSVSESNPLKTDALRNVLSDCLSGNSNALSPLTDEEDLFAVPHELPFDESSNKEMSNDSKNLFDGAPVLSPVEDKPDPVQFIQPSYEIERAKNMQNDLEDTGNSDDMFEREAHDSKILSSVSAPDKIHTKTILSSKNTEDMFAKHSDKWLDKDLEKSTEKLGLFDDEGGDVESDDDDDDDYDLFSSMKKQGKPRNKTKKNTSEVISQKPLFSPEVTFEVASKENERKTSSDNLPEFHEPPVHDISNLHSLPTTSKRISNDDGMADDENPLLSSQTVSATFVGEESDDLFSENKSTEEIKVGGSDKVSEKNIFQEKEKSRVESLFGDDSIESDDLFGSSVPKMSVSAPKLKNTKELLFDVGDDDDIFTLSLNKKKPKSDTLFSKNEDSLPSSKKDDDDLFSKRNSSSSSSSSSKNQGSKPLSTQKVQSFEDPLTLFNK